MQEHEPFDFINKFYDRIGLRQNSKSATKYILIYILVPLQIIIYIFHIINLRYKRNNVFEFTEAFEPLSNFAQLMLREFTIFKSLATIEKIVEDRSKFWSHGSTEFRRKTGRALRLLKIYVILSNVAVSSIILTPVFVEDVALPSSCWVPHDNQILLIVIYFLQAVFLFELALSPRLCDGLYLFLCTDLEIQLRLIAGTLRQMDLGASVSEVYQEECLKQLKKCSGHHRFLLKIHKKLNGVFSVYFLVQFFLNIVGVTIQFYVLGNSDSNITQIVRSVAYVIVVIVESSLTYIPATNVAIEEENLAQEIYNFDWYKTSNLKIRKFILFWLMKTQQPLQMSGGGLMVVDRNVFLQIFRTSFSISTLLRN